MNEAEPESSFLQVQGLVVGCMEKVVRKSFDLSGRVVRSGRATLDKQESLLVDSFNRLTEVTKSLERLEQIRRLASFSPPSKARIAKIDYVRLLIEAYYQELYIAENRIERWLKWHERTAEKGSSDKVAIRSLYTPVKDTFQTARTIRSEHVHEARISNEDLTWAGVLSFISNASHLAEAELVAYQAEAESTYKGVRATFLEKVRSDQAALNVLLEGLANDMLPILKKQLKDT